MKKSQFKSQIREEIISILKEDQTNNPNAGAIELPKNSTQPSDIKKYTDQGVNVKLDEEELRISLDKVIAKTLSEYFGPSKIPAQLVKDLIKDLEEAGYINKENLDESGDPGDPEEEMFEAIIDVLMKYNTDGNCILDSDYENVARDIMRLNNSAELEEAGRGRPKKNPDSEEGGDVETEDGFYKADKEFDTPEEKEPSVGAIKKADKAVGTSHASELEPSLAEKYAKLKKGILSKVAKLSLLDKSQQIKSPDLAILKNIINKPEVIRLFRTKGINVKDLVKDVIA